jgi:serine protease AprX
MSARGVRLHVLTILAMAGVLVPAAPAAPASTAAVVDPALGRQIDRLGFAPAILTWDRTEVNRSDVAGYLDDSGLEAHVLDGLSFAFACAGSTQDVDILAGAPGAVSVWGDRRLEPALDQSVPTAFNGDPHAIWDTDGLGVTGKGVAIGVVDTGVDATHPDLQYGSKTKLNTRVVVSKHDVMGPFSDPCIADQFTDQLQDTELTSGHGTHLASVAAGDGTASDGQYTGVAPGADIIGVGVADTITPQVAGGADQSTQLSLLGAIAGVNYVLWNGLEGCSPPYCPQFKALTAKVVLAGWTQKGLHDPWHPMTFLVRDLAWYGITVVFPVGNEGPTPSNCSAADTCHFNPFAVGAIGVAATPKTSRTALESYSSRGDPVPRQARDETVKYEPMLSAPGTGVVAARRVGVAPYAQPPGSILGAGPSGGQPGVDPKYVAMSGTSVSAAHVAGAIALMQEAAVKEKGCYLTASQVVNILKSTASPMPGYESWQVGAGALDITAAVAAARSAERVASIDPWMCPPGA